MLQRGLVVENVNIWFLNTFVSKIRSNDYSQVRYSRSTALTPHLLTLNKYVQPDDKTTIIIYARNKFHGSNSVVEILTVVSSFDFNSY